MRLCRKHEDTNVLSTDFLLKQREAGSLLLLGHTDGATTTAGGLGVLTAHTQTAKRERTVRNKNIKILTRHVTK